MSKPVLYYWKGRGRAETIRLMLAAAGVECDDAPYFQKAEDYAKLRQEGVLFFGQTPYLQWDGKHMVQTMSIVRYIARKFNMLGETDDQKYIVDMLTEGTRDFYSPMLMHGFVPGSEQKFVDTNIPKYMPVFENQLNQNGTGFLVGNKLTMADVSLLECLLVVNELAAEKFNQYRNCKNFLDMMKEVPSLKKYLSSDKRFGQNDSVYCKAVKETLGF